jgi:hypothetical protein
VCPAISEERVCNSYETCISYVILLGSVVPYEIMCEMNITQLLQILFLHQLQNTNSSVVGDAIFKISGI